MRGKKLIVSRMAATEVSCPQGELRVDHDRLFAGCADSAIELLEVQMEGKKQMPASEFLRGFQLASGERVGE